jgi:hypothetical protein
MNIYSIRELPVEINGGLKTLIQEPYLLQADPRGGHSLLVKKYKYNLE